MTRRARRTLGLFISISSWLAASACSTQSSTQSGYVISGRVVDPQQLQLEGARLGLGLESDVGFTSEVLDLNTDGSFVTRRLAAGTYVLQVVRMPQSRTQPDRIVAFSTVTLSTQDVNGVTITIRPDFAVHGKFRMETDNPAAHWPDYIGVSALLAFEGKPPQADMAADGTEGGRFWLHNAFGPRVIRTNYRLSGVQWWPTRVLLDGVDITNVPTDFSSREKSELEVVFTQHPAHFTFSVLGRDGQPIPNAWVIIVDAERKLWEEWATTTLIRQLYASASFEFATLPGRYLARGFPPDAFPSARAALQQLDRLMTGATPVDLRDRETKMLRLVVE